MNQNQSNTQQNTKTGISSTPIENSATENDPKKASSQSQNDTGKADQENAEETEVDKMMQGQELEKNVRGGDLADPDQLEK
ncbi:MAG: hypothetical protein ABIQ31_03820 [Ferruginibacter sp.]